MRRNRPIGVIVFTVGLIFALLPAALAADATVDWAWSAGAHGAGSCVTDAAGTCSIARGGLRNASTSATFTVTAITHATLAYDAAANHDPDGDSDGTVIVIIR